jgi:hypothetical protein
VVYHCRSGVYGCCNDVACSDDGLRAWAGSSSKGGCGQPVGDITEKAFRGTRSRYSQPGWGVGVEAWALDCTCTSNREGTGLLIGPSSPIVCSSAEVKTDAAGEGRAEHKNMTSACDGRGADEVETFPLAQSCSSAQIARVVKC